MRRVLLTTLALAGSLLIAVIGGAQANPSASRPTVACRLLDDALIAEFGSWGGPGTSVRRELFALVGSAGADRPGGWIVYGAATPTKAETDRACRTADLQNSVGSLSKPFSYRRTPTGGVSFRARDGEQIVGGRLHLRSIDVVASRRSFGTGFRCLVTGEVTVRVRDSRGQNGLVVGSELRAVVGRIPIAVAVLRKQGESFFRISNRCERR